MILYHFIKLRRIYILYVRYTLAQHLFVLNILIVLPFADIAFLIKNLVPARL